MDLHAGLRWGELTELRGGDVREDDGDELRAYLSVQRAVVDAGTEYTSDGTRFQVESTTKGGFDRRVGLSVAMTDRLLAYIDDHRIGEDDLLFPHSRLLAEWRQANPPARRRTLADMPADLPPAVSSTGRKYTHGTPNAYDTARCRCEWCRLAKTRQRAARRAQGKDRPTRGHSRRGQNVTDHCPDNWFRDRVWKPAVEAADFTRRVVFYDLCHSHATWLANSHDGGWRRTRDLRRARSRPITPPARSRPAPDDPFQVVYFRRHVDDDPGQAIPGREFLRACPPKVRATMVAVVTQMAAAPPHRFAGGGYWEAMHGDMTGFFEVRVDEPGRRHYRLFCLLDTDAAGHGPLLVILTGADKPFRSVLPSAVYDDVRALSREYLKRNPRSLA